MANSLSNRIERLARDLSQQRWSRAIYWTAAVGLAVAFGLILADYMTRSTDPGLRWIAAGSLLASLVLAAHHWMRPVWRKPVTNHTAAIEVQRHFPELGSRLSSAVEFLNQSSDDPRDGSAELRRAVVLDASSQVERLEIERVVDPQPTRRAAVAACAAIGLFVLFALADFQGLSTAAGRLLAPWSQLDWPRMHRLVVVDAPERLARGQVFEVAIADQQGRLPRQLQIFYRNATGDRERLETQLLPVAGDTAIARRENVQRSFAFRVTGGDDAAMPWRSVEVVDAPAVGNLTITATPPAYTGIDAQEVGPDLRLLSGTQLTLSAQSASPLNGAVVELRAGDTKTEVPCECDRLPEGQTTISIPRERWTVTTAQDSATTSRYRLRLNEAEGLLGYSDERLLIVEPDPVPEVAWQSPTTDLYVAHKALLPIATTVRDNLAIDRVDLLVSLSEEQATEKKTPTSMSLYVSGEDVTRSAASSFTVTHELDLTPLALNVGDQLVLAIEATDFRPGTGRTRTERLVTIISPEELSQRIADATAGLTQQLERALGSQRSVRAGAQQVEAMRQRDELARASVDQLTTLGYEQRQVAAVLNNPDTGAKSLANQLLEEIRINRLERPELSGKLDDLIAELANLEQGPLPAADRGLSDARNAAERSITSASEQQRRAMGEALAAANQSQSTTIKSLESLIDRLGVWSDNQRFVREVADLEREQRQLANAARQLAADRGQTPARALAAEQERLANQQAELARRFERLVRGLRDRIQNSGPSEPNEPLKDALAQANEQGTGGRIADAASQLQRGQLGLASEQQSAAAEDLKDMLDTLRDRAPQDPKQLLAELDRAKEELKEVRQQAAEAGQSPQQRQQLSDKSDRLARQLRRLSADKASQSTQQASQSMGQAAQENNDNGTQSMQEADRSLQQAEQQVAQRQRELKEQIARSVLQRLARDLQEYIVQQRGVLNGTVAANDASVDVQRTEAPRLAEEQQGLETALGFAIKDLEVRPAFATALGGATDAMHQATQRLRAADTSIRTQRHEHRALVRLQQVASALKSDPNQPPPESQQSPPPGAGQGGGQQPPSPIDVAELRMLRLMQLQLNAQTRAFEADTAASLLADEEVATTAERLAREQSLLADLVRELAARNNPPGADRAETTPLEVN